MMIISEVESDSRWRRFRVMGTMAAMSERVAGQKEKKQDLTSSSRNDQRDTPNSQKSSRLGTESAYRLNHRFVITAFFYRRPGQSAIEERRENISVPTPPLAGLAIPSNVQVEEAGQYR